MQCAEEGMMCIEKIVANNGAIEYYNLNEDIDQTAISDMIWGENWIDDDKWE